ncbi:aminoglycoside adenylyltransferase domain-containing protein [Halobacillus mangrovi]|uniref:Spectinomycin 9-adenylyltransferase n=1 Tax=Halobacillus mangrovi TaxID=402384 RepID=A0A1W5ZSC1_9BACI|nr:aminoglycoside adenylyltransferase domain-containing protein [Halobacillus mangrovi]ARI76194.1 hypothetical protein HM131_04795 [Halobacillus mangrovi]
MTNWNTSSSDVKTFVSKLVKGTKSILKEDFIGFYLHGSLALGGFNAKTSDVDVLVITHKEMSVKIKRQLARLCLNLSHQPFPLEISVLTINQLTNWKHPSLFDFHYSELWRERYQEDLDKGACQYINEDQGKDPDLAAHLTITTFRGICIEGPPIHNVFPSVPTSHYVSSILQDYQGCLENIEDDPVYSVLNIIRVYRYLKAGKILSKQEAGEWGEKVLPVHLNSTVHKALHSYKSGEKSIFDKKEHIIFRNDMSRKIEKLSYDNNEV